VPIHWFDVFYTFSVVLNIFFSILYNCGFYSKHFFSMIKVHFITQLATHDR
jgi:hypothetical protein